MDINALANLAAETEDQNVVQEHTEFERVLAPAGKTIGRLIEYIELGKQKQRPYQGKEKPDADEVRLTFELLGKGHINEIEVEGEKVKTSNVISVKIAKKFGERAAFKKLFNKLQYGRADKKHMAQMLNEPFIIEVQHNTVGEGKEAKTYANIRDKDGAFLISSPFVQDALSGETKDISKAVPQSLRSPKLFLWDHPTQETWDSLFIDGTREVKNGDKVEQVSKNWLQELIMSASNFNGSPLHTMLEGISTTDLKMSEEGEDLDDEIPFDEETSEVDPLAELGLS